MSADLVSAAVDRYFAAINRLDEAAFLDCFAAEIHSHDPYGAPPHVGHDGLRRFFHGIGGALASVTMELSHRYRAGDAEAVRFVARGTTKSGRAVAFEGIDLFRVDASGKICEIRAYWDQAALIRQLG